MRDLILVVNAGSSSMKFSLFETEPDGSLHAGTVGQVEGIGVASHFTVVDGAGHKLTDRRLAENDQKAAVAAILEWLGVYAGGERSLAAVGHRVVHGGRDFMEPVRVDHRVIAALEALTPLAPLHQPHHIAAIRAVADIAPGVPQVACFDTAFHQTQPRLAQEFALPGALTAKGVRRYGFHGLSYEYIVSALPELAPEVAHGRVVAAHLGNGASLCAIASGRSVATTMGFTPLDGLVMGTRPGLLDPGVVLYLMRHEGMSLDDVEELLWDRSGLLGVSAVSSDVRELIASGAASAKEAIDLFVYRITRELGSMAAALGGLDALIFTAGIGEHSPEIRARVCRNAGWLGITLDDAANAAGGPRISSADSEASAWLIPTDENLMVARHARRLLDQETRGS